MTDVAVQAGLTLLNVHGDGSGDYILDTNGNGAAFFDFDNDGNLDALIVNGSTRERLARGGDRMAALYRGDGTRPFTDVTALERVAARGWGMGTCIADIDNDGFDDVYVTAYGPERSCTGTPDLDGPAFQGCHATRPASATLAGAPDARLATTTATGFVDVCRQLRVVRCGEDRRSAAPRRTAATSGSTSSAGRGGLTPPR